MKNTGWIAGCLVVMVAMTAVQGQSVYEGESAALSGGAHVSSEHGGASNGQYVEGYEAVGAATTFTVTAAQSGFYDCSLRYGNGYAASSVSIFVNDALELVCPLSSTGAWSVWGVALMTIALKSGTNTIAVRFEEGDGGRVNIDCISLSATTRSAPDLSPGELSWSPAEPQEGEPVRLSVTLRNQGTGPSPQGLHEVAFLVNGTRVAMATGHTTALAPQAQVVVQADDTWSLPHGEYRIVAVVDPDNQITELRKNNNRDSASITFGRRPGPDLAITAIGTIPANPPVGGSVRFTVGVLNQGLDKVEAGKVEVQLSIGQSVFTATLDGQLDAGAAATLQVDGTWTAVTGATVMTATVDPENRVSESFEANNSFSRSIYIGRGAQVPWIQYEAEDGVVGGGARIVGPGRTLGTVEGEASGRRCVMLEQAGASVEWSVFEAANALVMRYCIPDAPGGGGIEATLSLYVNGQKKETLRLSSAQSWIYGDDQFQSDAPGPGARKLYTETHLLFNGYALKAGDRLMLRRDAGDNAPYYAIDLVDLEDVAPPRAKPEGYLDITDATQGWAPAIADDNIADDNAINQCIWAVQQGKFKGLYIPKGQFIQENKFMTDRIRIQGAGMWHSKIYCPSKSEDAGWGQTGFNINGDSCEFRDFAIFGWGGVRTQGGKAWVNSARKNTVIERVWVENVHCAYWVGGPRESTELIIRDCRFRNTGADAVNLCNGNLRSVIENCHARNTGDDAFAIWSARDLYGQPCVDNVIRNCTVQVTWRAACFAVYGGRGNRVENCWGADAITYPGLTVSSEFEPFAMESATIDGLTLQRCGGHYFSGYPYEGDFGAIWLRAEMENTANITIRNVDVYDATYQGIQMQGSGSFAKVLFENITIVNPATVGIQIKAGTRGEATFRNIVMQAGAATPFLDNRSTDFTVHDEGMSGMSRRIAPMAQPQVFCQVRSGGVQIGFVIEAATGRDVRGVDIELFAANGRLVHQVARRYYPAGRHLVSVERQVPGRGPLAAGFYVARVSIDRHSRVFPVMLR